ncbi:MAG: ferric reductase NAD binding domain-containing protein [Linnemannia gamsii]|nr:MAG: ferric reductase NAD binding domain-containing protein [Linnemannia gamsii]
MSTATAEAAVVDRKTSQDHQLNNNELTHRRQGEQQEQEKSLIDHAVAAGGKTAAHSQVWRLHDSTLQSKPSYNSSTASCSMDHHLLPTEAESIAGSQYLNPPIHSYLQQNTNSSATNNSSKSPLPTSPSQRSIEKAIAQKFASLGMAPDRPSWRLRFDQFLLNEGARLLFLSFWSVLQLLIFYFSFEIYNRSTHFSQARSTLGITLGVSRGAAAVINFDCGLILFSVCRNLISLLRATFLNNIVPFDKNILFHKTVAWSIVFFSVVHSAGHYVNYYRLEKAQQEEERGVEGGVKRSAQFMALLTGPGFTGHALVLILFLMVTSSVERVRRKGFETFWYTHHLFILFFITLMFHGAFCFIRADTPPYCKSSPASYKFVLGSLFFYILERTVREIRARLPTAISKIVLHPSKVLEVQIKKSSNKHGDGFFRAKAGQYVFLNCPDISAFEWHPFTITSAPEEDYVSVHIRIVGDWTTAFARRLGCSFDDEQQFWIEELRNRSSSGVVDGEEAIAGVGVGGGSGSSSAVAMDSMAFGSGASFIGGAKQRASASANSLQFQRSAEPTITLPRVLLDGPYGSPSEDAFNYEIAVLVGAGIGVTPFASVLKHIWYSVMQPTKIITLRKVYFFWVCRDRDAFEWFQDLLIALEEQNLTGFLEIRSYLTGELGKEEMDTVLMEARAAAAAAAARHFRNKHYYGGGGGGGMGVGDQGVEGKDEEGNLLTKPHKPLGGSGAFPMEVMLGEEMNGSNETLSDARDRDAITGLRSPTYYGRPNFDKIFGELAVAHPQEHGQVGVFFCGPKPLGKTLHRCARKYKFKFHKENF